MNPIPNHPLLPTEHDLKINANYRRMVLSQVSGWFLHLVEQNLVEQNQVLPRDQVLEVLDYSLLALYNAAEIAVYTNQGNNEAERIRGSRDRAEVAMWALGYDSDVVNEFRASFDRSITLRTRWVAHPVIALTQIMQQDVRSAVRDIVTAVCWFQHVTLVTLCRPTGNNRIILSLYSNPYHVWDGAMVGRIADIRNRMAGIIPFNPVPLDGQSRRQIAIDICNRILAQGDYAEHLVDPGDNTAITAISAQMIKVTSVRLLYHNLKAWMRADPTLRQFSDNIDPIDRIIENNLGDQRDADAHFQHMRDPILSAQTEGTFTPGEIALIALTTPDHFLSRARLYWKILNIVDPQFDPSLEILQDLCQKRLNFLMNLEPV